MQKKMKSKAIKEYQIAISRNDKIHQEYDQLMGYFRGNSNVTDLEARNKPRDKEARRMRQELSKGWKIARAKS